MRNLIIRKQNTKKNLITCATLFLLLIIISLESCTGLKKYHEQKSQLNKIKEELLVARKKIENDKKYSDSLHSINHDYRLKISEHESIEYNLKDHIVELNEDIRNLMQSSNVLPSEPLPLEDSLYSKISDRVKKVIIHKDDTIRESNYVLTKGRLGFYAPTEMYHKKTYDAYGVVKDILSGENVKSIIKREVKSINRSTNIDFQDKDFIVEEVEFYEYAKLELETSSKGLKIKSMHNHDKQKIADKMENWHWEITPDNEHPEQQLTLKVTLYDKDEKWIGDVTKRHKIDIKVRTFEVFLDNTKKLFLDPQWLFGSMVIPFLAFLFGRYKRKKKNVNGGNNV